MKKTRSGPVFVDAKFARSTGQARFRCILWRFANAATACSLEDRLGRALRRRSTMVGLQLIDLHPENPTKRHKMHRNRDHPETQQAAQQLERELRDQLANQAASLAQAQLQGVALQERMDDLQRQLGEEKRSHEGTRGLLATALADIRKTGTVRRSAARKTK